MIPPAPGPAAPSRVPAARVWSSYSRCHIYAWRQTPGSQVSDKAPLWASCSALTDLGYQVYHQPELCQHPPGGNTDFKGLEIIILALWDTIAHIYIPWHHFSKILTYVSSTVSSHPLPPKEEKQNNQNGMATSPRSHGVKITQGKRPVSITTQS